MTAFYDIEALSFEQPPFQLDKLTFIIRMLAFHKARITFKDYV